MFILYQRDDCHLCDLAMGVLAQARFPAFDSVFIDDDPALEARYGARVPVLQDAATGSGLDWPFDAAEVQTWLAEDRSCRPPAGTTADDSDLAPA